MNERRAGLLSEAYSTSYNTKYAPPVPRFSASHKTETHEPSQGTSPALSTYKSSQTQVWNNRTESLYDRRNWHRILLMDGT